MLTIGKIGGTGGRWRSPDYYTQQVAQGAEDYYSGRGEAPGRWTGAGAAALGLKGAVDRGQLHALFERRDPLTGAQLGRPPGEGAVKGIDLQMAVPKSVSTLWALADEYGAPDVALKVWEATHGAGVAALDYLERNACTSRAGKGGHVRLAGEGFVGAAFAHRFSREGDPQIHIHFLVANMTHCDDPARGVDSRWRTLDARDLYTHRLAAGYVFQAELRERLTRDLGVAWTAVRKGAAEIDGVPLALTAALSRRRAQILDALGRDGRSGTAREAELAALTTRRSKRSYDLAEQRRQWRALAEEHGFGPAELASTLRRAEFADLDRAELSATAHDLLGPGGLTRERSTFNRADVVRELAAAHARGGSVKRIEQAADRLIASDPVVAVQNPAGETAAKVRGRAAAHGDPLLTTADMLDLEAAMIDQAAARIGAGAGLAPVGNSGSFAHRPGGLVLSDEQQTMVRRLVSSGHGVEVIRARAGSGKTTALDAAREMWERAGLHVVGAALAGRAADELHSRAGIASYTVHGLLRELDRGGPWRLDSSTVLVIDEGAMVDSRRLARLLDHAADVNAKVVLIGDDRQVPAVDAGGAFTALADRLGAIELTEVHRQRHAWDRAALNELRHGDVGRWIDTYRQHGRLVPCQGSDAQLVALVQDWWVAAEQHGLIDTVMLATTRHDAEDLNQLARAAQVAAGTLDDNVALAVAGRVFTVGDRILALRNEWVPLSERDGSHLLRNGNRGTVTNIDHDAGNLNVELDGGPPIVLPADYLADRHAAHGYAMTIHKAQGMTTSHTFVLGSPDLARELGYVASSRHRDAARFYINVGDTNADRPQLPGLEDQPLYADLERALGREAAKRLALDISETDANVSELTTAQLIELRDRGQQILTTIPLHAQRAHDGRALERVATKALATERRLQAARAELADLGRRERQRRDQLHQRIQQLEHTLQALREEVADRTDQAATAADRIAADRELDIIDAAAAEQELAARRSDAYWRATRTVTLDADPTIERHLGRRPDSPTDRERWEQAAAAQESYRLQYGAFPHDHEPTELAGRQAHDWHEANRLADALFDSPGSPVRPVARSRDDSWEPSPWQR